MTTRALVLFLISTFLIDASRAQEPGEAAFVLMNWGPSKNHCNDKNTQAVTLMRLLSEPETFIGRCVQTDGVFKAGALFLNGRDASKDFPSSNNSIAKRRLGVYAGERKMKSLYFENGQTISVSGLVSDCSELHDENTVMVLGYCHYSGGPIIGLNPD